MTLIAREESTVEQIADEAELIVEPAEQPGNPIVRIARRYGPIIVVFLGMIGLWYLMHYVIMGENSRFKLPPPHAVVKEAFFVGKARAELFEGLKNTARVAFYGFGLAVLLALVGAVLMALSRGMERALFPYAVILQTLPILALVPLFKAWFGPTRTARIVACILISIFPILTSFLFGLKSVDRGHRDLFELHGASWWTRLWKLQFPAALPSIFTGLRIGAGLCVVGALVADAFFTRGDLGLGRLLDNYGQKLQYERLFGGVILASVFGVLIYAVISWLSNRLLRSWHESESSQS
jgi:NitT/TauT family transport system permease protein